MNRFMTTFTLGTILILGSLALQAQDNKLKVDNVKGIGNYLTDENGITLYWFKKDSPGKSVCKGDCLKNWPVFYREDLAPAEGTTADDYATLTREDGTKQTTFRGYPLYYFAGDMMKKKLTKGNNARGIWFVIDPAKFPPK